LPNADPANETLEHFERFCWTLRNPDTGERFKLEEWQLGPLEDFFAGQADATYPTQLWEWPTGTGKSTLNGAIVLHHATYVVRRPRVFVIGGEFVHARNTLDAASAFIYESRERGGLLGQWWEPQEYLGGRIIPTWIDDPDLGIIARSAGRSVERKGGSSVEGKDPTLIVVEELHRHNDGGAAVSVLITKTVKAASRGRTVKALIGTTAGTDRDSYLGRLENTVLDEEAGATVQKNLRPGEYHTRAISADGETLAHIWAVPEGISPPSKDDEDLLDEFMTHVKRANPASWISPRALKRVWKALSRVGRWQFLRQNCCQWVAAGFGAIDRGQWWKLKSAEAIIPHGRQYKVFVGLDRAQKWDSTVIAPVWAPKEGPLVCAGVVVLDSPRNGQRRKTRDVGVILEMMRERWPSMVVVFDRAQGGGDVAEELEEEHGLTIVDHSQGTAFDLASMRLAEVVEAERLIHDGNPAFSKQVLSAVMKPTAGGKRWRGESPDRDTQIDGFDALAMAVNAATSDDVATSKRVFNPEDYRVQQL
jgi:hypothetical protein